MSLQAYQLFFDDVVVRLLTILATPALLISFVLLYYDLRVRKENYDSERPDAGADVLNGRDRCRTIPGSRVLAIVVGAAVLVIALRAAGR